jgi:hypothetical protein
MIKIILLNLLSIILLFFYIFKIIIPIVKDKIFTFLEFVGFTLMTIGGFLLLFYIVVFIFPLIENYKNNQTLFDQLMDPTNKKISYLFESKFYNVINSIGFLSFFLMLFGELLIISSKIDKSKEKK